MKKRLLSLLLLCTLVFALSGCGEKTLLNKKEPVSLSFWHVYGEQAGSPMDLLVQEFNRTVANERTQQRARLTDKRGAITDEVFGDAREKLVAFTESDGYADFLKKSAAGFAAVFPQGDVTVYVRPGDMHFADDIKNAFGRDCKVESSDEITIGGCRAGVAGGSTVADDTLDTRLEAQREWFLENSGMSVIL